MYVKFNTYICITKGVVVYGRQGLIQFKLYGGNVLYPNYNDFLNNNRECVVLTSIGRQVASRMN